MGILCCTGASEVLDTLVVEVFRGMFYLMNVTTDVFFMTQQPPCV